MVNLKLVNFCIVFLVTVALHDTKSENIDTLLNLQFVKFKEQLLEYKSKVLTDNSNECFSTYYNLLENWNQNDVAFNFLLKLIDSSSKIQNGITGYNSFNLGSFDICYDLQGNLDENIIYGKYCLTSIPIFASSFKNNTLVNEESLSKKLELLATKDIPEGIISAGLTFEQAFCVPSVCSAKNMNDIIEYILADYSFLPKPIFSDDKCYSKDRSPELTTGAIFTIAFLSIILLLVIISSFYEYYLLLSEKKPIHEILIAFSVISNTKKIIKSSKNPEQLLCLNGVKAISMAWVIIGHEYEFYQQGPIENGLDLLAVRTDKQSMWLLSGTLAVDSFFAVGGLVTVYTYLKSQDKGIPFNIPLYYLHRYLRLTPVLAVLVLIYANLLNYLGNGPLWYNIESNYMKDCRDYWWSTILYIQNFVNVDRQCIVQTWYLSNDFQMFLLSPFVLYFLTKMPKVGYSILGMLNVLGFVIPTIISYHYELCAFSNGNEEASENYMNLLYYQTHSRFGPYVIGMAFGAVIYKMRRNKIEPKKTKKNILIAIFIWVIALGGLFGSAYGGADLLEDCNLIGNTFYNGFHKNTWSISLGLVILLCVSGFSGPIDSFLSLPVFQLITKLSYCMYLLHFITIAFRVLSTRVSIRFSHIGTFHIFWSDFMATIALSFIFCLCFELPVIILEKYLINGLMGKSTNSKSKTSTKDTN